MFIVPISSLTPMQSLTKSQEVNAPVAKNGFAGFFQEALDNARETRAVADQDSIDLALGKTDNLAQVMINAAKASTATQMTVDLTSRAVSAYKEIMQMQV